MTDTRMTDLEDLQAVVDRCLQLKTQVDRQRRLEKWKAFCPICQTDILDELEKAAYDWGRYGLPEHCTVRCPGCGAEVEFDLEWTAILEHANLAKPQGPG